MVEGKYKEAIDLIECSAMDDSISYSNQVMFYKATCLMKTHNFV